jgi:SAM-dependent methyltransferase
MATGRNKEIIGRIMVMNKNQHTGSIIDPFYSSGQFQSESGGGRDAVYKISQLAKFLSQTGYKFESVRKVADVGCGSGKTTFLLSDLFVQFGCPEVLVEGYDIHPAIASYSGNDKVRFIQADFCGVNSEYDLVFLFDVFEHVPDPVSFLRKISERTSWLICHIPLDDSFVSGMRNLPLNNLRHPGHLIVLDIPAALNVMSFAGFRTMSYSFSPVFRAPSGKDSLFQKCMYPLREILFRVNPFLLQKLLGGVSLYLLAASSKGMDSSL